MVKTVNELMKGRGPDKKKRKPRGGYQVGTQLRFGHNKHQGIYIK